MEYLHNNRIIIGNLISDNILLDKDGHIKIKEFETVTQLKENEEYSTEGINFVDYTYFAPECYNGKYEYSADFFSLGCILISMLFRTIPFKFTLKQLLKDRRIPIDNSFDQDYRFRQIYK